MRSTLVPVLAILLLAGLVFAQDGEGHKTPFDQEDMKALQTIGQDLQLAFQNKDYEQGLALLERQLPIIEKALARIEAGEVDLGEATENWKKALTQGNSGVPGLATTFYNVACCQSMLGQKEAALESLKKSIEAGYLEVDHMKLDTDLDPIRNEAGYKALIEALDYNDVFATYVPEGLGEGAAPLVVFLHGDEENEKIALEAWKPLADDLKAVLVTPRGPIMISKDSFGWKRHSDDEEGALRKIKATIAAVKGERSVSAVYVVGYRNGGYFASLTGLQSPDLVKGVVPINAFWNKYYFEDFLGKAKAGGLKVCFIHGKEDPFFGKSGDAVNQLSEAGIGAKRIEFDGGKAMPDNAKDLVKQAIVWLGS